MRWGQEKWTIRKACLCDKTNYNNKKVGSEWRHQNETRIQKLNRLLAIQNERVDKKVGLEEVTRRKD